MRVLPWVFILSFLLISCKNDSTKQTDSEDTTEVVMPELSIISNKEGKKIIRTLEDAGDKNRETADILYNYKGQNYRIDRNCGWFEFMHDLSETGSDEVWKIDNMEVVQFINNRPRRDLADSTKLRLTKNLRKKLFLLELPFGLNSPTVQKEFLRNEEINGKSLAKLKVEFIEDNYEQPYLVKAVFWVDEKTEEVIYLAIKFGEETSPISFLKPINKRVIKEVKFTDYEVYHPKRNKHFALEDLAKAFENDKLDQDETMEYQNIQVTLSENNCD